MALSREKILDTAFDLLSRYGLADLSMRRLATELDVAPGALYYHVKNKQELLASLASRMVADVDFSAGPPEKSLEFGALELHRRLAPVRESAEVIRLALALHPDELSFIRQAVEIFLEIRGFAADLQDDTTDLEGQAELAAKSLLHLCMSLIEEEQTRALLAGVEAVGEVPPSYLLAVRSLIKGWSSSLRD